MLAIRLQRTGRAGLAQFRLIVQDSRYSPTSGRVVAQLGHYDPHTKKLVVKGDEISQYLDNGAQPSNRTARLLKKEGVKLPDWVRLDPDKKRAIRNPDKLRRNRPTGEPAPSSAKATEGKPADLSAGASAKEEAAPAEETPPEGAPTETEAPAAERPAAEPVADASTKEVKPVEEPAAAAKPEEPPAAEAEPAKADTPAKPDKTA